MRILYGVQGTGNGHISRARALSSRFANSSCEVDYLFSGRATDGYFNMEVFGDYQTRRGLTFIAENGRIDYLASTLALRPGQFLRDLRELPVQNYDLVITDFEPLTAWAAKRQGVPSLGLAHQYAFRYDVPLRGANYLARKVLRDFAPAQDYLGFHYHHFGQPILPPLIQIPATSGQPLADNIVLVYLPFEDPFRYRDLFSQFPEYQFHQYHPVKQADCRNNHSILPTSRQDFIDTLQQAHGVITSAGFSTTSECLHLGQRLITIPVQGQMEQLSNAAALEQLQLASTCTELTDGLLQQWLHSPPPKAQNYTDVASAIVSWIESGMTQSVAEFARSLWPA